MVRRRIGIGLLAVSLLACTSTVRADEPVDIDNTPLGKYVAKPDASYQWTKRSDGKLGTAGYVELIMTSQTWRGTPWKHQLFIVKPSVMKPGKQQALLYITDGAWHDHLEQPRRGQQKLPREAMVFATIAEQLQSPVAVLMQVPRQPMFDNLYEDQIIALTFEKYLETGDPTWPLLLPMTKAAVRAMDTVQAYAKQEWKEFSVDAFTVTGASKRGWTTWLTGAVDKRAGAIAPMVIDTLNMGPQMRHQVEAWGKPSDRIRDYTERNLHKRLSEPAGQVLRSIVDPYAYRSLLTQPKLILIGTNDHYWPVDALNLYWDDLRGAKHILYVPNDRHGLKDYRRVIGSIAALHRDATGRAALPNLSWEFNPNGKSVMLRIDSDATPAAVTAWVAHAPTRDFRDAQWAAQPTKRNGEGWTFDMPYPKQGYSAVFAEATYPSEGLPFYLSTNLRVMNSEGVQDASPSEPAE